MQQRRKIQLSQNIEKMRTYTRELEEEEEGVHDKLLTSKGLSGVIQTYQDEISQAERQKEVIKDSIAENFKDISHLVDTNKLQESALKIQETQVYDEDMEKEKGHDLYGARHENLLFARSLDKFKK